MTDDLAPLYRDFGLVVTRADASTFRAVLDAPSRDAFEVRAGELRLRYITADAADLAEADTLTIGGTGYTVATPPERINDGSESEAALVT